MAVAASEFDANRVFKMKYSAKYCRFNIAVVAQIEDLLFLGATSDAGSYSTINAVQKVNVIF